MKTRLMLPILGAALVFCLPGSAAADPQRGGACRYQPGKQFKAAVHITVSDHEVASDTATVNIHTTIPSGGRRSPSNGGTRYVAPLAPLKVHLDKDTVKHFDLVASVVVENPDSPNCQLKLDMATPSRSWAKQDQTNFGFTSDVAVGGQHSVTKTAMAISCLDEDTPILLADGTRVPIARLIRGDLIRNPVTNAVTEVMEVIHGTQADEEMYRIGFDKTLVSFTARHPIMTDSGLKPARAIQVGDSILGDDGAYHAVSVREAFTGDPARRVFNLRLGASPGASVEHMMSAGGIITGDYYLQNVLQGTGPTR